MIHSMTAFARRTEQNAWGTAAWELRSVNHRYMELSIRLPETLRELEPALRERFRNAIVRGKIECTLKFTPVEGAATQLNINKQWVKQLSQAALNINEIFTTTPPTVLEVLAWPGVLQVGEINAEKLQASLMQLFEQTLIDFIAFRRREGEAIVGIIKDRLTKMQQKIDIVRKRIPNILELQRQKLLQRFAEAKLELDAERLEQELLLLAQKTDVMEEIERLEIHINETNRTLREDGAVGRRLDFLMQELNRETNTLASKSIDAETSSIAVDLKVLIEQMREQVQNIE